ncbi:GNAT family N-acetyltransferase [Oceanobacillus piezotolerans]|uniref:GNAT family N-acetyltransferase n=2 Tax=Oceanobacillus piezotolerans TaxID=2448030 RepID=A0A498DL45_9BACI|nr:GNAT family N-acetyltransferase [Oceanobacillus piezotolerans]
MERFPVLETNRLQLVEISHQHEEALYDILSRKEVTLYYGKDNMVYRSEARELVENLRQLYKQRRCIRWGLILKEKDLLIGTVGLNNLSIWSKKADISYELHPSYWRQRLTTEAVQEVLDYAFGHLGLFRVGAITYPENHASNQLLSKIGFKKEGILRGYLHQSYASHDAIVQSLLKPEWKKEYEIEEKLQYHDHLTEMVKKAEKDGQFDFLPGKGKPLKLEQEYLANSGEKQLYKTMKDNHVLPNWVKLSKEIEQLKEEIKHVQGSQRRRKLKEINKKIKDYNYACPTSLQKNKMVE